MKYLLLPVIALLLVTALPAQVTVKRLLCENRKDPIGLDVLQPRLSWQLETEKRNIHQTAYEIRVSENPAALIKGKDLNWSSGKVSSDASVHIVYNGNVLQADKRYFWQVRVWDNEGNASMWSAPAFWQMGLVQASNWKATWIQPGFEDSSQGPAPLFRKTFKLTKTVTSATAYITAHGLYEATINGSKVGDAYLAPGWTSYNKRLEYQAYDVSNLFRKGDNAIGVTLADGWYRGVMGFNNHKNNYGKDISLLFQLELHYSDGSKETVVSDASWKSSTGSVMSSGIYDGEVIDNRNEKKGWMKADYNDAGWNTVKTADLPKDIIVATVNEPVRSHEEFHPMKVFQTPAGDKVIDFGQNLVGWVQVKVKGKAGDKITIYHAEVLDKQGNFYTENLRAAKALDEYVLSGEGEEVFEPHFTFHGFRYIKVVSSAGEIHPEDYTAFALYSDMTPTGNFSCSDTLLNKLQHNIQWGQKGNFLDVPTDCPQRDERLGWTGDAQVFSRTAAFDMNVNNFFAKWLRDVEADQLPNGSVPFVIPNILGAGSAGATGWADVATIIPWNMYLAYADKRILEQQYGSMKAWVEFMKGASKDDLWNKGFHFGDWLSYAPDDDAGGTAAITDKYLIAQCFYARSTQLVINAATVLNKTDDVQKYTDLLQRIKTAFLKEYVTQNGRLSSNTQTAYVLALNFDMLPENLRAQAADRLVENIKAYNNHLTTGFLGTPYLCHVLSRFGHTDVAYTLLLQQTYPSWLYPVKMGATTIWERWDGIRPDGSFEAASMNSFNHYAYGSIGDWMYRVIAGIDTYEDGPGYKHIKIMPHIGGNLTQATAELQTYYGKVSSSWNVSENGLLMDVEIPANTTATIYLPASSIVSIKENNMPLTNANGLSVKGQNDSYFIIEIGSGYYHFAIGK